MHFDFAALLVILTLVTGVIWLADAWFFGRNRKSGPVAATAKGVVAEGEGDSEGPPKSHYLGLVLLVSGLFLAYGNISGKFPTVRFAGFFTATVGMFLAWRWLVIVEYARSFFPVILAVLVIRSFMFEPFRIPSSSMVPTLLIGDFILVNKFSYGIRLPVLDTKIWDFGQPERGDVIVFRYPCDPSKDYIKRVIGMPGDTVEVNNKQVWINGEHIKRQRVGLYQGKGRNRARPRSAPEVWNESLLGVDHEMMIYPRDKDNYGGTWTVPPGHYFVMGDNRDQSADSRAWSCSHIDRSLHAFVPEENLVGKALLVWMHFDLQNGVIGWSRLGESI